MYSWVMIRIPVDLAGQVGGLALLSAWRLLHHRDANHFPTPIGGRVLNRAKRRAD